VDIPRDEIAVEIEARQVEDVPPRPPHRVALEEVHHV